MRTANGVLVTLALFLGITGAAVGSRVEGARAPSLVTPGAGNDGEGPVTFTLQGAPAADPMPSRSTGPSLSLRQRLLAERRHGRAEYGAGLKRALRLRRGQLHRPGHLRHSDSQPTGTARVKRGGCDSRVLAFTINLG